MSAKNNIYENNDTFVLLPIPCQPKVDVSIRVGLILVFDTFERHPNPQRS